MKETETVSTLPTGSELREKRMAKGIRASFVGAKIGVSPSYLTDLEKGRRTWTEDRVKAYLAAIGEPVS